MADVLAVLQPIWLEKPVTARRVKQRIGTVMNWAIANGWRQDDPNGDNALMVKISAGTTLPRHSHTGSYHGILVQGNWVHSNAKGEDFSLMPGSYVYQTGKVNHGDHCEGDVDCMILVHRHEAGDFIPEE